MPATSRPTFRRRRLAAELRSFRDRTGATWEEVRAELGFSHAKLSRIETAEVGVSVADCKGLVRFYGADAATIDRFGESARQAKLKGWWYTHAGAMPEPLADYLEVEEEASVIDSFTIDVIPGLLQTTDHTRALMEAWSDIDPTRVAALVELRHQRQRRLHDGSLKLWTIVDESALRRTVGGWATHREQLVHLAEVAESHSGVTLQVLPFDHGSHAAIGNAFSVIHFDNYDPVAFADTITGGLFFEDADAVRAHRETFDKLRAAALDHRSSLDIVRRYVNDLGEGGHAT